MLRAAVAVTGLLLLVCGVEGQIVFGCSKDYCNNANCPDLAEDCDGAREVRNASECGCCHICVKPLEEKESCLTSLFATTPRLECGAGLKCQEEIDSNNRIKRSCIPADLACTEALANFTQEVDGQELTQGIPRPKCDELGFYQAVQCKPGMICYCVNKQGGRIFGTAPYTEEGTMDCNCSRALDQLMDLKVMKQEDTKYFLRCAANGDYDGPQCTDTECYCINKKGEITAQGIRNQNGRIDSLRCYNAKNHGTSFVTTCLQAVQDWEARVQNASNYDVTVVGLDRPICDPDGSFSPKQCKNNECYCVKKDGSKYSGEPVPRYSQEATEMKCNCRREKDLLKNIVDNKVTMMFASYMCSKNGNYLPIQCTSSICICVDENGFQKHSSHAGLVSERHHLECHKPEYEGILNII